MQKILDTVPDAQLVLCNSWLFSISCVSQGFPEKQNQQGARACTRACVCVCVRACIKKFVMRNWVM